MARNAIVLYYVLILYDYVTLSAIFVGIGPKQKTGPLMLQADTSSKKILLCSWQGKWIKRLAFQKSNICWLSKGKIRTLWNQLSGHLPSQFWTPFGFPPLGSVRRRSEIPHYPLFWTDVSASTKGWKTFATNSTMTFFAIFLEELFVKETPLQ